jgi:DNA-binding NarL/FixJ family response regulator
MDDEVRIVIADDHPVLRHGLVRVIESDPLLKVVAETGDGTAALAQIRALAPRIAVLDADMPKLDGLGVLREIQKRRLPVEVVFLTIHDEEDLFDTAIELGAKGYILKDSALTEIVAGIRAVSAGKHYWSAALAGYLVQRRNRTQAFAQRHPSLNDLTPSERRILGMIAHGKSSKQIAAELFIHHRTVENHRTNICEKMNLHGPNTLLRFALQHKSEL